MCCPLTNRLSNTIILLYIDPGDYRSCEGAFSEEVMPWIKEVILLLKESDWLDWYFFLCISYSNSYCLLKYADAEPLTLMSSEALNMLFLPSLWPWYCFYLRNSVQAYSLAMLALAVMFVSFRLWKTTCSCLCSFFPGMLMNGKATRDL